MSYYWFNKQEILQKAKEKHSKKKLHRRVTQIVSGPPFNCYQCKNQYNKSKRKITKFKNQKKKFFLDIKYLKR